jgi:hypothetical protein
VPHHSELGLARLDIDCKQHTKQQPRTCDPGCSRFAYRCLPEQWTTSNADNVQPLSLDFLHS